MILNSQEIEILKVSGKILSNSLKKVVLGVKPGIKASELNRIAEEEIRRQGAKPAFLNYPPDSDNPFPYSLCVSVNHEVVHGLASDTKVLKEGDIVGLDLGANYKGIFTDMAKSVIVGKAKSQKDIELLKVTEEALRVGIEHAVAGKKTGDIGYAIETYVKSKGYDVVRSLVGHGVGHSPHEDPQVPNFGYQNKGDLLVKNMAIAIEPMVVVGKHEVRTGKDGWTVLTADYKNAAHFEHTVLITDKKPVIITAG